MTTGKDQRITYRLHVHPDSEVVYDIFQFLFFFTFTKINCVRKIDTSSFLIFLHCFIRSDS